jgi:hypothetical protein
MTSDDNCATITNNGEQISHVLRYDPCTEAEYLEALNKAKIILGI